MLPVPIMLSLIFQTIYLTAVSANCIATESTGKARYIYSSSGWLIQPALRRAATHSRKQYMRTLAEEKKKKPLSPQNKI